MVKLFCLRLYQYLRYRPKSWWRSLVAQMSFAIGSTHVPVGPTLLDSEPTNFCNQKCPGCATGDGSIERPRGTMKPPVFSKLMEAMGKSVNFSYLYCLGESFLNKNIYSYISSAKEKKIYTVIDTNGTIMDVQKVLASGLDQLNFHISGTTQEIHDMYRKGGKLADIISNIRKLTEARKLMPESKTSIRFGMIVFRQNEHQIDEFFALAKDLEVDEAYLIEGKVANSNLKVMEDMLTQIEDLQVYDEQMLKQGVLKRKNKSKCSFPWHGVAVAWNGDVHPCCHDYYGQHKIGNIMEEDFDKIWNSKKIQNFRRQLLENEDIPMCRECPGYGIGAAVTNLTRTPPAKGKAQVV